MKKFILFLVSISFLATVGCSTATVKEEVRKEVKPEPIVEKKIEPIVEKVVTPPIVNVVKTVIQEPVEPIVVNGIDWANRTITATGIGAPNPDAPNMAVKRAGAINAAKMYAIRDMLATVKGMYLSSESTVENYMTTSDVVKTQVEGIAKAFKMVGKPHYFEDGSVEVTVVMSLSGDLSDIAMGGQSFDADAAVVGEADYKLSDIVTPGVYTGLIVDCRAVQLRPALSPKVFSKAGAEVYGSANVSKEFAVQQGMLGYLKDVEKAKQNSRVVGNPLVINAIGVKGTNKADIIISDEDAAKIKELSSKLNFLQECRVIA
ncbi:MAG: hypothetical protein GQ534_11465, partial [Candidatus Delongbacteria bacterium]|nr:hypothetical protein [Candidatus Delongbacteria bacterium]